ncbi:hypothetical protein [Pseudolabrys sp. FHR47]|uniref:hypothetical protein n=1 Tax=Pseudolabrys sp. FHR47 TaxID=2562284 RepID=UPI0010BF4312|nr:hypothetical protein [Pseudolabrys sp. FHR47]
MWDKVKDWFRHSVTILWARFVTCAGLVMVAIESALQDPVVSQAIQSALQPRYIPYFVIAIGLVTELARRRTLNRD